MNQKQMLAKLLEPMSLTMREYAVKLWLEDINWHRESAIIALTRPDYVEALEELDYHLRPSNYSISYVISQREENKEAYTAVTRYLSVSDRDEGIINYKGYRMEWEDLHQFKLATQAAHAMSYVWGWGLNTPSWNGQTVGENLVLQLRECIDNPETMGGE